MVNSNMMRQYRRSPDELKERGLVKRMKLTLVRCVVIMLMYNDRHNIVIILI